MKKGGLFLVAFSCIILGFLTPDLTGSLRSHREACELPPVTHLTRQPDAPSRTRPPPQPPVKRTFHGDLQTLFPIRVKTKPPQTAAPFVAGSKPVTEILSCKDADSAGVVTVEGVREGHVLHIQRGLIDDVQRSWFGLSEQRKQDTTGLVDAFVEDGGLILEIDPDVLGGHPGPKGENKLFLAFVCSDSSATAARKGALTPEERALAKRVQDAWAAEEAEVAAQKTSPDTFCDFRETTYRMSDDEMPSACLNPKATGEQQAKCYSDFYTGVSKYAQRVGTAPVSPWKALRCMLKPFLTPPRSYTVGELQAFARAHHVVWLVRIKDRKVSWDATGKFTSWKSEGASYSLLQMAINVLEDVIRADVDGWFQAQKTPVYMLINALDNPVVGPPSDAPWQAPDTERQQLLRSSHQAENIPSKSFIDDWTQWGSGNLFNPSDKLIPVFSWSTVPGWHRDIIAPNLHPGSCHKFFFDHKIAATPFERKEDTVLFRAFSSACDRNGKGPRQRLVCYADDKKHEVTIGTTKVKLDIGGGRGWGPTGSQKFMTPARQAKQKYILLLDGVVAAFRSTWLLQTGSVILATGAWKDVRTQLLKPWIHYIPVSSDLADFESALATVVNNQTYAKWVSDNARAASFLLSGAPTEHGASFDRQYYNKAVQYLSKTVTVTGDDEVSWTSDKHCGDWLSTTGRIRQCLPDTYACTPDKLPPPSAHVVHKNFFGGQG